MSATPRNLDRHDQKSIGFRVPWAFAHRLDMIIAQWSACHPGKTISRMAFIRSTLEQAVQAEEDKNPEHFRESK